MMSPFLTYDIKGMHCKRAALYHPHCCIQQYHYISISYVFEQCHKGTWENVDQQSFFLNKTAEEREREKREREREKKRDREKREREREREREDRERESKRELEREKGGEIVREREREKAMVLLILNCDLRAKFCFITSKRLFF